MWTQKPAVLVTTGDKVMQAFKVVKAKSGAFEVHFSTSPTGGLRDDVKMKSMDLWARAPRPGLKHIILGAVGGEFHDEAGERAARITSVTTSAGGSVTVRASAYKVGGRKASAKAFDWVAFWTKYKRAAADEAREKTSARADEEEGSSDDSSSDADSEGDGEPGPKRQHKAATAVPKNGGMPPQWLSRQPALALSRDQAEHAVSSAVSARLHAAAAAIEQAWQSAGGDVAKAITCVVSNVREDLRRALLSNRRVDAAGEYDYAKRSLPPVVHLVSRGLAEGVCQDLQARALEDSTGQHFMRRRSAMELADAVVMGAVCLSDFISASNEMLGAAAQRKDSLGELQDGCELMRTALSAVTQRVLLRSPDEGLGLMDRRVRITADATVAKLDVRSPVASAVRAGVARLVTARAGQLVKQAGGISHVRRQHAVHAGVREELRQRVQLPPDGSSVARAAAGRHASGGY